MPIIRRRISHPNGIRRHLVFLAFYKYIKTSACAVEVDDYTYIILFIAIDESTIFKT